MSGEVVKVKSWEEFRRLVLEIRPSSIVYNIEQNGLSPARELTNLRLIIPSQKAYYIFLDFSRGDRLKETSILLRKDEKGNRYIDEKDVIDFLKSQLGKNLKFCSYWTI